MKLYLVIPPIIAFVLLFSLAVIVLLRDFRRPTYRLFSVFLVGMGLWALIIFGLRISPAEHAKIWADVLGPIGALTSTYLHKSLYLSFMVD